MKIHTWWLELHASTLHIIEAVAAFMLPTVRQRNED